MMRLFLNRYIIASLITTTTLALATSCSDNLYTEDNQFDESDKIAFTADLSQDWYQTKDDPKTRAIDEATDKAKPIKMEYGGGQKLYLHPNIVNGISETEPKDVASTRSSQTTGKVIESNSSNTPTADFVFGVSAYQHAKSAAATSANFIANQSTSKSGSVYVPSDHNYYWPDASKQLDFYAHYPTSGTGFTYTDGTAGVPTLHYEVPAAASSQMDIMVAKSLNQNKTSSTYTQPLAFSHLMTCVTFSIGDLVDDGTIQSISLKGVKYVGDYKYNPSDANHPWTLGTGTRDFTSSPNHVYNTTEKNVTITSRGGAQAFMMLPQTFASSSTAKIEIVFIDAAKVKHTLNASLANQNWIAGTTVDYKITTSSIYWNDVITAEVNAVPYYGGDATFKVVSYRTTTSGKKKEAVPWEVVGYSTDGKNFSTTVPSILKKITYTTHTGSVSGESGTWTANAQTSHTDKIVGAAINNTLKNRAVKGSTTNRYDLSLYDTYGNLLPNGRSTANCYVITSPGYYTFPLVYGNAIKDGKTNSIAYTGSPCKNYKDGTITSPWIKTDGTPYDAILIWQDAQNVIRSTSVKYNSKENGYIDFDITKADIQQCNAILAIRDNSSSHNIMWSWHIWVAYPNSTGIVPVTNASGKSYNMMAVNLGYVIDTLNVINYDSRIAYVKVKQNTSGNAETIFKLEQNNITSTGEGVGSNPYYQYGRKDPMMRPVCFQDDTHVASYASAGYEYKASAGKVSIGTSIKNPNIFYTAPSSGAGLLDWCSTTYYNYWAAKEDTKDLTITSSTKTIYDPCPVEFVIPVTQAFTGFGAIGYGESGVQRKGDFHHGFTYYVDSKKELTIFLPALGWEKTETGTPGSVGAANDFWTINTIDVDYAARVYQDTGGGYQLGTGERRAYGFNIRPVRE